MTSLVSSFTCPGAQSSSPTTACWLPRSRWVKLASVSVAAYLCLSAVVLAAGLCLNRGAFVYALDDPYIHLALARTWLRSHTVGVSPGQFAPASSSPLWTAIVTAIGAVVGVAHWIPLALNVASSLGLLLLFWWGMETIRVNRTSESFPAMRWYLAAALVPVIMNLPALMYCGMEHILHSLLTIGFTVALFRCLERNESPPWAVWALAALLPLIRLEALFTAAAGALLFARHRRYRRAVATLLCTGLPTLLLGLYYWRNGAFVLPNSVVAKAVPLSVLGWLTKWATTLVGVAVDPLLLLLSIMLCAWWARPRKCHRPERFQYFLVIAVLHLGLSTVGGFGWLDRYESYLVTLALFLALPHLLALPSKTFVEIRSRPALRAIALLAVLAVGEKLIMLVAAPLGSNDIYQQQYQVARFIEQHFPSGNMVANDIGLVSFRAGGNVTDLEGLGSTDVLRLSRELPDSSLITEEMIEPILRRNGADVIVIYPQWYSEQLYGNWRSVAEWRFERPQLTAAHNSVVFFAVDENRARILKRRLMAFESELPSSVHTTYEPAVLPEQSKPKK